VTGGESVPYGLELSRGLNVGGCPFNTRIMDAGQP